MFVYISPTCRETPNGRIRIKVCKESRLVDLINGVKFYLNRVRGFDSVEVEFLASTQERDVAVNRGLELPFSL